MIVPSLVRRESFMGTGYVPQSEDDLYKTQDEFYLAGTAEVPTMGYHMNEVLEAKDFPIKYFSFSPCFRRETGAHGKDTKGFVRVHEFYKLEQVVLCEASHEDERQISRRTDRECRRDDQAPKNPVSCGRELCRRSRARAGEEI